MLVLLNAFYEEDAYQEAVYVHRCILLNWDTSLKAQWCLLLKCNVTCCIAGEYTATNNNNKQENTFNIWLSWDKSQKTNIRSKQ